MSERLIIVDWGMGTLQLVVMEEGEIMHTKCVSRKMGMHLALEEIGKGLGGLPVYEVDKMVQAGKIDGATEYIKANARIINQEIANLNYTADRAILVGGGMVKGWDYINPTADKRVVARDPQRAAAKGFAKAAIRLWRKNRA